MKIQYFAFTPHVGDAYIEMYEGASQKIAEEIAAERARCTGNPFYVVAASSFDEAYDKAYNDYL